MIALAESDERIAAVILLAWCGVWWIGARWWYRLGSKAGVCARCGHLVRRDGTCLPGCES